MRWSRPNDIGPFDPIPSRLQPRKVWRHLHSPVEGWENLVGVALAALVTQARAAGCPPWVPGKYAPSLRAAGADVLRRQHDEVWADVYGPILAHPETRCGRSQADGRWVLLAPDGVFGVVTSEAPARVWTVYRPHPLGLTVSPSEEDFRCFATERWLRETGMSTTTLRSELERREPDALGIWRLARAVGAAEGDADGGVAGARDAALAWLGGAAAEARASAIPDRVALLDAVEAVLADENADVSGVLLDLEDAVSVTRVLAGEIAKDDLVESIGALLDWCPPELSRMSGWIAERAAQGPIAARDLWARVGDAVVGAALKELPAVHRPATSLAAILTAPPWWERWTHELARTSQDVVRTLLAPQAGWVVAAARLSSQGGAWDVVPPPALAKSGVRVFIVHADAPSGEDVTNDLAAGQPLWELDQPGDEVRAIIVEGAAVRSLAEAFTAAERDSAVRITVVEINRPR